MGVYLPTGAVGNGKMLSTFGASGELMSLFWPRLDFAQHVHEGLPAVYLGHPQQGQFLWTWQADGARNQHYVTDTNVLVTEVEVAHAGIRLRFTDFCPPDDPVLVRRVNVENASDGQFAGAFMHYFELWLGEAEWKQAVHVEPDHDCMLQYFRDYSAAVGGTPPDMWRCGKWTRQDDGSAKVDMYDGHLTGQREDIGQVNFSLAWRLNLPPGGSRDIDLLIVLDHSREGAVERMASLRKTGAAALEDQTVADDRAWLSRARKLDLTEADHEAYHRALLSLRLLYDRATGAMIAAPEFDPGYEMCGGYGYCWPRDAAEAALALEDAGYGEYVDGVAAWMAKAQLPSGVWGQRYWCDGPVASSWALREDFLQLDETASALMLLCRALQRTVEESRTDREDMPVEKLWQSIKRGAQALIDRLDDRGFHARACDLWETYAGIFTYTQAGFATALKAAADVARALGEAQDAKRFQTQSDRAREAALSLYGGGYFARGRTNGVVDSAADSSVLGLIDPFPILDLRDGDDRDKAASTLMVLQRRLGHDYSPGQGMRRYEGDGYLGGCVGAVNTLWSGLICYHMAETATDKQEADRYVTEAQNYVLTVLARRTPTGLLPELIPGTPGIPYWAVPHAWCSGLMVKCALAADACRRKAKG